LRRLKSPPAETNGLRCVLGRHFQPSTGFAAEPAVVTPHLVLAMFLVAQAFDGLFTYVVVQSYGIAAEGNILLATWIDLVGLGPAIVGAKLLAGSCGVLLYCLGVRRALLGLTVFYIAAAIVPWLVVLQHT
jgi:hypothetical protein